MPVSITHLRKNERTVTKDYGEHGSLTITWRPGELTPHDEASISDAVEQGRMSTATAEALLRIVVAWDLLDDEGETIPLTSDALAALPSSVLDEVWTIVRNDQSDPKEGEPSDAG